MLPNAPDPAPGEVPALRPLTAAERAYLDMLGRRYRVLFPLLGGGPLIAGAVYGFTLMVQNDFDKASLVVMLPLVVLFGGVGLALPISAYRSRNAARDPRYAVGPHAGIFNILGQPLRHTIGGVRVNLPDGWQPHFAPFEYVEVELYPAPGDPIHKNLPRHVISAFGGRLSIDREVRSGARRTDGYAWVAPGGAVPPAAAGRVAPGPSPE